MSVEDRLLVLLNQARQTGGDGALRDGAGLRSRLSSQAPDLHGEIQALAAALAMGAPGRIAAATDGDAERAAVAAEIARQERLSMSVVEPGLAAACIGGAGIGPIASASAPPPGGDDWAGDSVVVGADAPAPHVPGQDDWAGDSIAVGAAASAPVPPQPQPQGAGFPPPPQPSAAPPPLAAPPSMAPPPGAYPPPHGGYGAGGYPPAPGPYGGPVPAPFYTQTWFFAVIAAIIITAAVGYTVWRNWGGSGSAPSTQVTQPVTPPGPVSSGQHPPVTPPQTSGPQPGGPTLSPLGTAPVRLPIQTTPDGRIAIGFRVVAESGPIDGLVILPRGGWEGETTVLARNGAGAQSIGTGRMTLDHSDDNSPARGMQVQWQQDGVGAGATEIAFGSAPGQADVVLSGAGMCVADPESQQVIGCGRVE